MAKDNEHPTAETSFARSIGLPANWLQTFGEGDSDDHKDDEHKDEHQNPDDDKNKGKDNPPQVTFTPEQQAEIDRRIAAARKEEKDKLYPDLEAAKKTAKTASEEAKQAKETVQNLTTELLGSKQTLADLQEQVTKLTQEKPSDEGKKKEEKPVGEKKDEKTPIEQQLESVLTAVSTLTTKIEAQDKKIEQQEADRKAEALRAYRERVIAGIPAEFAALVPSDSQENIDKAVNNIKSGLEKVTPAPTPSRSGSLLTANIRMPGAPATATPIQGEELDPAAVSRMSPEEYAQFRTANPHMFGGGQRVGYQGFGGAGIRRQ